MSTEHFIIRSSNGEWQANKKTGGVLNPQDRYPCSDGKLLQLIRFDVEEYKKHYGVEEIPDSVDILDMGYWFRGRYLTDRLDHGYEEPAHDWRILTKELRDQNQAVIKNNG